MQLRLVLNTISLLLVYVVSYLSGNGFINYTTIGEVSRKYETLITPAGYVFSIWGLIYFLLACFVGYQWYLFKKDEGNSILKQIGTWFIYVNLANISWMFAWLYESIGMSVVIMLVLLYCLFQLIKNLNMENWDAPVATIFFIWWPICIYFGWVIFAAIVNIAAFYESIGWEGGSLGSAGWAVLLIGIGVIIYSVLVYKRNMREAAMVGAWGFLGIACKQLGEYNSIVIAALTGAVILLMYAAYHGYKNRATSPFRKLKR